MLASLEGVATGQAQSTLANGQRLGQLPGTEAALRTGELSGPKVTELTGAGILAPEREAELLAGAGEAPLQAVRERCQRSRATSGAEDPKARVVRIRAARHFSSWTDAEGAFCYQGQDTPDRGAQILSHLDQVATRLRRARRTAGEGDSRSRTGGPGRCLLRPGHQTPPRHRAPLGPGHPAPVAPGRIPKRPRADGSSDGPTCRPPRRITPMPGPRRPTTGRPVRPHRRAPDLLGDGPGGPRGPVAGPRRR